METTEEYYTRRILELHKAVCHYLEKVRAVKTSDTHEQARHAINLDYCRDRCETWEYTATNVGWKETRRLETDVKFLIGGAAVWLLRRA